MSSKSDMSEIGAIIYHEAKFLSCCESIEEDKYVLLKHNGGMGIA